MATKKAVKKVAKKATKKNVGGGKSWDAKELAEIKASLELILTGKRAGAVFVITEHEDKTGAQVHGGVREMNRMDIIGHVFNALDIPQSAILGVMAMSGK